MEGEVMLIVALYKIKPTYKDDCVASVSPFGN